MQETRSPHGYVFINNETKVERKDKTANTINKDESCLEAADIDQMSQREEADHEHVNNELDNISGIKEDPVIDDVTSKNGKSTICPEEDFVMDDNLNNKKGRLKVSSERNLSIDDCVRSKKVNLNITPEEDSITYGHVTSKRENAKVSPESDPTEDKNVTSKKVRLNITSEDDSITDVYVTSRKRDLKISLAGDSSIDDYVTSKKVSLDINLDEDSVTDDYISSKKGNPNIIPKSDPTIDDYVTNKKVRLYFNPEEDSVTDDYVFSKKGNPNISPKSDPTLDYFTSIKLRLNINPEEDFIIDDNISSKKENHNVSPEGDPIIDDYVNSKKISLDINPEEDSVTDGFSKKGNPKISAESSPIMDDYVTSNKGRPRISPKFDDYNNKCYCCGQLVNSPDTIYYKGHPRNAIDEFAALTDEDLDISTGGDVFKRPIVNITDFCVYDQLAHLCHIDNGLVENRVKLYMSGYLKSADSDFPEVEEDFIPVKDVGPILEWEIQVVDNMDISYVKVFTALAEYHLLEPTTQYKPLIDSLLEKYWISRIVIEYLEKNHELEPSYDDLLTNLECNFIPGLNDKTKTENMLLKHAQFVCEKVNNMKFDDDCNPLITMPCLKHLAKLGGIKVGKYKATTSIKANDEQEHTLENTTKEDKQFRKLEFRKKTLLRWMQCTDKRKQLAQNSGKKIDRRPRSKATTTPLVRKIFQSLFTKQLDKINEGLVPRKTRCDCKGCTLPDCRECYICKAKSTLGRKCTEKPCVRRYCLNNSKDFSDDLSQSESTISEGQQSFVKGRYTEINAKPFKPNVQWIGEPVATDDEKVYYETVEVNDLKLHNGEFVELKADPPLIARLAYMWKEISNPGEGYFHAEVFINSVDTVFGKIGDPRELFLCDRCCHRASLSYIERKTNVVRKEISFDWCDPGDGDAKKNTVYDKTYFYSNFYDTVTGQFLDLPGSPTCPNQQRIHKFCSSCERKSMKEERTMPSLLGQISKACSFVPDGRNEWSTLIVDGHNFEKGCGVFLNSDTFDLDYSMQEEDDKLKINKVDAEIYTEYYRKRTKKFRGSNANTPQPFCVGCIKAITSIKRRKKIVKPEDIFLEVSIMYRPENTNNRFPYREDLNLVYWTDETCEVSLFEVVGPCHLVYDKNFPDLGSLREWLERDSNRFYFSSAYDVIAERVVNVPEHAKTVGKNYVTDEQRNSDSSEVEASGREKVRPLRSLDIFSGCGGLSEGLYQGGAVECHWAVDNDEEATRAYSLNNKECTVFTEDCNTILRDILAGATHWGDLRLPRRGEVELICGGPPCQGFSGLNRFSSRDYSKFKNSLIVTFLSYCDFYRPKYIVLENVRNFVTFKRGMALKLTMRALVDMGYQCSFGLLQAGQYGVPQTRRRLIVLAAAPGFVLPLYPEPTHTFNEKPWSLSVRVDGRRFTTNLKWIGSAPRRTCTVWDAISELPEIVSGASCTEMSYGSTPETHFQRDARKSSANILKDHICKKLSPLMQARIDHIPTTLGADWRDLPNIVVQLSDGTKCKVLEYRYDTADGPSPAGARRGVCACAGGGACAPADRQLNTLIPWFMPHTAARHNDWAGLCGRLWWEGYCGTTLTEPEPLGKQGRVLHPAQKRLLSVRECARSQAFPDHYVVCGSLLDKHRQIGNAVPPPLGAALGREIVKAIQANSK